ncbi:hypothetical protein A2U01_0081127, partial [Trifolium medium]|nr:hypothetical protein [Trifolium medium]
MQSKTRSTRKFMVQSNSAAAAMAEVVQ